MGWFTLTHNPHNHYCGFNRDHAVLQGHDCGVDVIQQYLAPSSQGELLIGYYRAHVPPSSGIRLIYIGDDCPLCNCGEWELIGFDCGYFYDEQEDFYAGFSTIANEMLRMDNPLHHEYRSRLNASALFPTAELATAYGRDRETSLADNRYHLEDAFSTFTVLPIYCNTVPSSMRQPSEPN